MARARRKSTSAAAATSSVREVVAVVSVDGREVARGNAAGVLQDALRGAAGYPDAG